ncbi:MAG: hypothetical protein ACKVWR_17755, partial [Acidimicrobiales bacterium]
LALLAASLAPAAASGAAWPAATLGLDPTFNPLGAPPGVLTAGVQGEGAAALDAALGPDGSLVVVGYVEGGDRDRSLVLRLRPDGGLDPAFNPAGPLPGALIGGEGCAGGLDWANQVEVSADGSILVACLASRSVTGPLSVARLTRSGALDPAWANAAGGRRSFSGAAVSALASDGAGGAYAVVQGASLGPAGDRHTTLVRLDASGGLDGGFGHVGGAAPLDDCSLGCLEVSGLARTPTGDVVVAGWRPFPAPDGGVGHRSRLLRYDAEGRPKPLYSGVSRLPALVRSLAVDADGALVISGRYDGEEGLDPAPFVARLDADGVPDPLFGASGGVRVGAVLHPLTPWPQREVQAAAPAPGGAVVAAGLEADPRSAPHLTLLHLAPGLRPAQTGVRTPLAAGAASEIRALLPAGPGAWTAVGTLLSPGPSGAAQPRLLAARVAGG